jgi:hypothetical protein
LNPSDPRTNFGVSQNQLKETMVVGRDADPSGNYTTQVPAMKSAELLGQNTDTVMGNTQTLRDMGEHCFDADKRKMPFTYPGCKTTP